MRILHVIDYFQPILGYQETYLVRAQQENGHDVLVLTSDRYAPVLFKGGAAKSILGGRMRERGLNVEENIRVCRLPSRLEVYNNVWLGGLRAAVLDFAPEAIHVHGVFSFNAIRLSLLKRRMKHTRLVLDEHKTYGTRTRSWWARSVYASYRLLFRNLILNNADAMVAVTEETKDLMVRLYGIPEHAIERIPLGCDTTLFARSKNDALEIRKELGIPPERVVFCYVGKITPEKGVDILVDAATQLMKAGMDIGILCVGGRDQRYFEDLLKAVAETGQGSRFLFLPPVPNRELFRYYSASDVGVWPEQCSLTMLEAMACGLPIIISDTSGAPERVESHKTGFLYRGGDIRDLASKMEILTDAGTRETMSKNAREKAMELDWRIISSRFEEIYAGKTILNH